MPVRLDPSVSGPGSFDLVVHPPKTIGDRLEDALQPLRHVKRFRSAAVTRRDGLVIHHTFPSAREAAGLSAMAAAMVGAARTTGAELGQGIPEYGFFQFHRGILVIQDAGPEAVLACLLQKDVDIGFAIPRISDVSDNVRETLEGW